MSASRSGRKLALATTLTGLIAAPLAVISTARRPTQPLSTIQILGTNDFHGRLLGATVDDGRRGPVRRCGELSWSPRNPNTVFAAAGDLIGASTFESFIQNDKPTLDALNAAGLDVSAAGNHEFDQGYHDLVNRVMKPYDATSNPRGRANWQYIAANVRKKSDDTYALPDVTPHPDAKPSDGATWMKTTSGGVKVGFVGAVTEDLLRWSSPAGIADLKVTRIVAEVNDGARPAQGRRRRRRHPARARGRRRRRTAAR